MENFLQNIEEIIESSIIPTDEKIAHVKAFLSEVKVEQITGKIAEGDSEIPVKITYKSEPIEGAGICAKDIDDWCFKPSKSKENGVANVKIVSRGSVETKETYFIITNYWKRPFFIENGIEVPYFKVDLS